ncbi:ribosome-associated protein [Frondihabitans sp. PhB188]|uniref:alternative ribosome rescue aminoacyl-tRNA hydrolase ArfB n=1 Tax=Frondihabitans sp. PhB188 TaxID=2485200 RepID=UPI000F47A377|nr:alternative ribosome rescue aminoacyl-tRNA hydrolase ArfB [Frondihabitans sp. PhB188]ROQ38701.1 ribosome-associated protein [Frondihabitans sp. PhB188]
MDLEVTPELTIPAGELRWQFSRSSGPGGQHVNTSDTRAQVSWSPAASAVLTDDQRALLFARLAGRLVGGEVRAVSSEQRSQLQNRESALAKLAAVIAAGLAPEAAPRRPTRRTRGSDRRRLDAKSERSATKRNRQRPPSE